MDNGYALAQALDYCWVVCGDKYEMISDFDFVGVSTWYENPVEVGNLAREERQKGRLTNSRSSSKPRGCSD